MMIPGFETYINIEPIEKGWSEDKKYCITAVDGAKFLLRITPTSRYDTRKALFKMLQWVSAIGIPMCQPIEFGICEDGVYALHSWIDGEDAEAALPTLSETEQYMLGKKSGEILRRIHSIPAPPAQEGWADRFNRKIDRNIKMHKDCPIKFDGSECMTQYINENRSLLSDRPQCFQHGDYHIGNMVIENGELVIIDFDRVDFGDPWEEFNRITWCAQASPHFATGMVDGYFSSEPPIEFWRLLALYISSNMLASVPWAIPFGQDEVDTMLNQAKDVLLWYDKMKNPVPTWYIPNFYYQLIDGLPCRLKAPFDFSFLGKYGTVFKIFDEQNGGNVCFGTEKEGKRYFVKFAGAPQAGYDGKIEDAISRLKFSIQVYQDIGEHENLIRFISAEEIGGGFALVFEWTDAVGIGRMYPAAHKQFAELPLVAKKEVFNDILEFHAHVTARGYAAIDFYDGSIMYDFASEKAMICDIDFYQKTPYYGSMGLWGSSRFVSPEECKAGELIDEITTVYTMGATAFCLFADSDRSLEVWSLGSDSYDVVKRATSNKRDNRQQTVRQFMVEWDSALLSSSD